MPLSKSKKRRLRKKRQQAQIKLKKSENQAAKQAQREALSQGTKKEIETNEANHETCIQLETSQQRNFEDTTGNADVNKLEILHIDRERTEDNTNVKEVAKNDATTKVDIKDGKRSWQGIVLKICLFTLLFYQLLFTV